MVLLFYSSQQITNNIQIQTSTNISPLLLFQKISDRFFTSITSTISVALAIKIAENDNFLTKKTRNACQILWPLTKTSD